MTHPHPHSQAYPAGAPTVILSELSQATSGISRWTTSRSLLDRSAFDGRPYLSSTLAHAISSARSFLTSGSLIGGGSRMRWVPPSYFASLLSQGVRSVQFRPWWMLWQFHLEVLVLMVIVARCLRRDAHRLLLTRIRSPNIEAYLEDRLKDAMRSNSSGRGVSGSRNRNRDRSRHLTSDGLRQGRVGSRHLTPDGFREVWASSDSGSTVRVTARVTARDRDREGWGWESAFAELAFWQAMLMDAVSIVVDVAHRLGVLLPLVAFEAWFLIAAATALFDGVAYAYEVERAQRVADAGYWVLLKKLWKDVRLP